ncbi:hypothetical protein ES703_19870 [subsurface metagenome]
MNHTWKRINLSHYTSDKQINAEWKESVPNRLSEFLRFTIQVDEVIKIISGELLQMKIYEAGGDEIAQTSRGLIAGLAKKDALPKEIIEWNYPYDISWKDQQSSRLADNLKIVLPSRLAFVVFHPGDSVIFQVLSASTVPAIPHENTLFSYHVYLFDGSYSRYIELKTRAAVAEDQAKRR